MLPKGGILTVRYSMFWLCSISSVAFQNEMSLDLGSSMYPCIRTTGYFNVEAVSKVSNKDTLHGKVGRPMSQDVCRKMRWM